MATWKQRATNPKTGKPKRGAFSRIAERLGVKYSTVKMWYHGIWTPIPEHARGLQDIVHSRVDLSPKKRKDAGKKRVSSLRSA